MGCVVNANKPRLLYSRERTGTHCIEGWMSLRAGLDRCGKSRPPPGFDPRAVQPVGSCYTDYATRPTSYSLCTRLLAADFQVFIGDLINLGTAFYDLIPSKAVAKWTSCYGLPGHSVLGASHSVAYVIIALRPSVI